MSSYRALAKITRGSADSAAATMLVISVICRHLLLRRVAVIGV